MDFLKYAVNVFQVIGPEYFIFFSGWFVAMLAVGMMVWRMIHHDRFITKELKDLQGSINDMKNDIRRQIDEMDDVTFDLVTDATKTMTILAEKIGSMQMIMMQLMSKG